MNQELKVGQIWEEVWLDGSPGERVTVVEIVGVKVVVEFHNQERAKLSVEYFRTWFQYAGESVK